MNGNETATPRAVAEQVALGDLGHFKACALVKTRNKVCTTPRWQHTQPDPEHFEETWRRLLPLGYEPAVTLRTSGLIGFESDGEDDLFALTETLCRHEVWPWLIEAREDAASRRHVYARQSEGIDLPKVSFRFEAGRLTAASNNYYRVSYPGGPYSVRSTNPDAPPISAEAYAGLLADADAAQEKTRSARREGAPLAEGSRRNEVFRFACALSRWTEDFALACNLADRWQEAFCDPPISRSWVEQQVKGAWNIAESEGRLGCEVFAHATRRVQVANFARAIAAWCGDDHDLIIELAELWAAA